MKVALHTLGCKLNFAETSTIGEQFLSNGFRVVNAKNKADIYVLNTCSVTENAERECRQVVRRFLRQNPEAFIIVTGCYAQLRPEELSTIEGVDAVLGSSEKFNIFSLIKNFEKKNLACVFVKPTAELSEFGHAHSTDADSRTRAYLKIQDGCDYKCSFCTIPLARGKSRSMSPNEVTYEFKKLVDSGYKEIILTGVNVGDYGKNINSSLFELLLELIKINGEFRIRISSIEPNLLSYELIELIASSEKLCKHFHIPLQSGSDDILKLMQRRYTTSDYAKLIGKIINRIPDAGIGIDVIVGFPGESDNHFKETCRFLKNLPFSYLHVFTYSERPSTKALEIDDKVDVFERRERNNILRSLSEKKRNDFYKQMIGEELDVLFETENHNGNMSGFSSNYVRVSHPFSESSTNNIIRVEIKGLKENTCTGEIVDIKNAIDLVA